MNVSPNFSPSIKLMKPYFLFSSFFYTLSMIWIFFLDINIDINNDLLFFDEIQECPKAINSFKFFCEEKIELAVI